MCVGPLGTFPGTDVMILKIFSPKHLAKTLHFVTQNTDGLRKIWIIALVFKKNDIFFAENWGKLLKILIIASTPLSDRAFPGEFLSPYSLSNSFLRPVFFITELCRQIVCYFFPR
jgi:hypothetical protein